MPGDSQEIPLERKSTVTWVDQDGLDAGGRSSPTNQNASSNTARPPVTLPSDAATPRDLSSDEGRSRSKYGFPLQVYFILGNEFCERFSYYGMNAILLIFLTQAMNIQDEKATAIYHAFKMLCYFSPIFGAIIADSFWGKFKTIWVLSIIYAAGNVLVAASSIPDVLDQVQMAGPMLGLLLIAIGTGGIKPCVSAFGGDQFERGQERQIQTYFSLFYFSINFGSLLSMIITPMLRGDVTCFGEDCYPLAFGLPAVLMLLSLVIFVLGSRLYRKIPPQGNMLVKVSSAVTHAIAEKIRHRSTGETRPHWMDWAREKYGIMLVQDIKLLFRVLLLFLPLPVFWALFDQQGSRWTLQAMEMNGHVSGVGSIKADQMQALNPILIMLLIPLFDNMIYPFLQRFNVLVKPLQRMCAGMLLAGFSFIVAGVIQLRMESVSPVAMLPATGFANFRVINAVPCRLVVKGTMETYIKTISSLQTSDYAFVPTSTKSIDVETSGCAYNYSFNYKLRFRKPLSYSLVIGNNHSKLAGTMMEDEIGLPSMKQTRIRFVHAAPVLTDNLTVTFDGTTYNISPFKATNYTTVDAGSHAVEILPFGHSEVLTKTDVELKGGAAITSVIIPNNEMDGVRILMAVEFEPRPLSILWQIPQYTIISAGEVLFSITGLEFAYSQSPDDLKSCVMAGWLLTVSVGNLLVVILAEAKLTDNMAHEFFMFAGMMAAVSFLFAIISHFYKYVDAFGLPVEEAVEDDEEVGNDRRPLLNQS